MAADPQHRTLRGRAQSTPDPLEFESTTSVSAPVEEVAAEAEVDGRARLERSAWWWIRAAAVTVALFVGWQLLLVVQGWVVGLLTVVLFIIFGAVVAFAAAPLMHALERIRTPHLLAVLVSLVTVVGVVAGLLYLIAGPLATEITSLVNQAPRLVAGAQQRLQQLDQALAARGIHLGNASGVNGLLGNPGGLASRLGSALITGVAGVVTVLVDTVIVLVTAFWLLNDGPALRRGLISSMPSRVRDHAEFGIDAVQAVIGGYVRAQLFLAGVIGAMAWIGCLALGVPFPVVVGVAAGVFELVPMLGPFLGGAVGVALALTKSPVLALWTVVLFVGIHVIEGYILAPRIQARFIQLHPLVAFLALIAGIEVDGILGALFAVPAASLAAVFLRAALGDWRANRPDLFAGSAQEAHVERRRRVLLREFRVLRHSPWVLLTRFGPVGWVRRRVFGQTLEDPMADADEEVMTGSPPG